MPDEAFGAVSAPLTDDGENRCVAHVVAAAEAQSLLPAWRDLYEESIERNPFFSPWFLPPALARLDGRGVKLAIVSSRDGARLHALAPVTLANGYGRVLSRHAEIWRSRHTFYAAPLIRKGAANAAAALLAAIEKAAPDGLFIRLPQLDENGPVFAAVEGAAKGDRRVARRSGRYQRAVLEGGFDAQSHIARTVRKKKRKEYARLANRLCEEGGVILRSLRDAGELEEWQADFLALEHAGWKGREGTSIAARDDDAAFFRCALKGAFEAGALDFHRLDKNGRPFAMIVNFIGAGEGYSFKIAYDEAQARFSPGVMMELELLKILERRKDLRFMDSCANPDHPMINSLWDARRPIIGVNVSRKNWSSRAMVAALHHAQSAAARIRTMHGARIK